MKKFLESGLRKIIILTLQCLWFIAIAFPIMMTLERPPVTTWTKREILNPDKTVAPGETLRLRIEATINKECPGTVVRFITDGSDRVFNFAEEPRPDQDAYDVEMIIPLGAFPGPAKYGARIKWRCNWVQEWWPKETNQAPLPFMIAPVPGQLQNPDQQGIYVDPAAVDSMTVLSGADGN